MEPVEHNAGKCEAHEPTPVVAGPVYMWKCKRCGIPMQSPLRFGFQEARKPNNRLNELELLPPESKPYWEAEALEASLTDDQHLQCHDERIAHRILNSLVIIAIGLVVLLILMHIR